MGPEYSMYPHPSPSFYLKTGMIIVNILRLSEQTDPHTPFHHGGSWSPARARTEFKYRKKFLFIAMRFYWVEKR